MRFSAIDRLPVRRGRCAPGRGPARALEALAFLALAAALAYGAAPPESRGAAPEVAQELAARVDPYVTAQLRRHGIPGAAVALVRGGEVELLSGYGVAGDGTHVGPDTRLLLGSVSKSITALVVMQLVDEGRLDLDAPVTRYLPWFRVAEPGFADRITLRDLLHHTSGLSSRTFIAAARLGPRATLEDLARALAAARPVAEPGTHFEYFNDNYNLLGYLVEVASGSSYADAVARRVFDPLGMTRTTADPGSVNDLAPGTVAAFGGALRLPQSLPRYGVPAGYIASTARDMTRYVRALLGRGSLDGVRVVSMRGALELFAGGAGAPGYGMGWMLGTDGGERRIEHGGANETYKAEVVLFPDARDAVVLLAPHDGLPAAYVAFPSLREGLVAFVRGRPPPPPVRSVRWVGVGVLAGLLVALLAGAWQVRWAGRWARRMARRHPLRAVSALAPHLVVPAAAALAVVLVARGVTGRGFHWTALLMVPDLALAGAVWVAGELAALLARAVALARLRTAVRAPGGGAVGEGRPAARAVAGPRRRARREPPTE